MKKLQEPSSSRIAPLLRGTLYGSLLTLSLSALLAQAAGADGIFGDYFTRMVTTACGTADGVVTSFDTSGPTFGTKICTSFQTLLSNKNIYTQGGNVGIGVANPTERLDVNGNIRSVKLVDSNDAGYYIDPNYRSNVRFLSGETLQATGIIANTDIDAHRNIWAQTYVDRDNPAYSVDPSGMSNVNTINVARNVSAGKIQINDTVTPGTACSPNGLVARDAAGAVLSCQSGVWSNIGATGTPGLITRSNFHQIFAGKSASTLHYTHRIQVSADGRLITMYGFYKRPFTCNVELGIDNTIGCRVLDMKISLTLNGVDIGESCVPECEVIHYHGPGKLLWD